MPASHPTDSAFLAQVTAAVMENLSDERFGVSELAGKMHMSRSNLLRRIKHSANLSVSQLIREIRLKQGRELLEHSTLTVSEVSRQVGFGGTSYFIKCFREYYGYPPGEVSKRKEEDLPLDPDPEVAVQPRQKARPWVRAAIAAGIVIVLGVCIYLVWRPASPQPLEKSIVVLPFKNDSNDSTNLYLINGLMESTLNNLQKIKDLRVISRTSAEKYRHTSKSIPELADELNVGYIVEGSGQKSGNRILLNIQLIEARSDRHLWARQYEREVTDIFRLQQEIAKDIAKEVRAIITREEEQRIEKIPTTDLAAYDLFLKAAELIRPGGRENLEQGILYLKKAIERDPRFALAHAVMAIAYYYLDVYQVQRRYETEIGAYADKALLYDPSSPESLFAKALHYTYQKEYETAVPYLERALEYNPNSVRIIQFLADLYNNYIPNTAKYLEYALLGIRLDATKYDSTTTSYNYLHLSNALIQTGFVDESLHYIDRSLAYYPDNPFAGLLKAAIVFAKDHDPGKLEKSLLAELAKDSTQLTILQELGKLYYHSGDYEAAYKYYRRFVRLREARQLDIYQNADLTIGATWARMGMTEEAGRFVARFKEFADGDPSIYKHMHLAMYYAYLGDAPKTIRHLELFSKEDNYQYWILLFKDAPIVAPFKSMPAFKNVMNTIETRFWDTNKQIRKNLEEKGLL